jgi:tetratricopeptide (TPR) repeat protein
MTSSVPIIRQIAWLSVVPQIAILLLLIAIARLLEVREPLLAGALTYLAASFILRSVIPRHHRNGIYFYKKERFAEAIPYFYKSYEFFARHPWLDRWRAVTMLSPSRMSYKEMALINVAFCLAQAGERERSIQEYRRVLAEFPGSKMAEAALRLLEPQNPSGQPAIPADHPEAGAG